MHLLVRCILLLTLCFCAPSSLRAQQGDSTQVAIAQIRSRAEQGDPAAQNMMGRYYRFGFESFVPKDTKAALYWFQKAANQGCPEGMFNLGDMFEAGSGVERDYVAGVRWYRSAALKGHEVAQLRMGQAYNNGLGCPRNYIEAYAWASLSAARGNVFARDLLDKAEKSLTPEQIERAQQRGLELEKEIKAAGSSK